MTIWELDFYSRPILDESQKKLWEVLICETPTQIDCTADSLFYYSQFCPSKTVNSIWLRGAIEKAIAQAGVTPKKIRFFRRQMNNMIAKACEDLGIPHAPSRRTYTLQQWIEGRLKTFYPQQEGYDPASAQSTPLQYPDLNAIALPDAIRGDRTDKWSFVSLPASELAGMGEWEISFGEVFSLNLMGVTPEMRIPGLIIFSPRALPLAAWMSGLEMGYLKVEMGQRPFVCLETDVSDSWILANLSGAQTIAEGEGFEKAKQKAENVHFLAVQSHPKSESLAGFWLMKESC
jgi:hypothetical protein